MSESDRKVISILVGSHHAFGELLMVKNSDMQTYIKKFLKKIRAQVSFAGYTLPITARLIRLIVLISAADVRGAQRVECIHPYNVFNVVIDSSPEIVHANALDTFKEFEYEVRGKNLRKLLIQATEN